MSASISCLLNRLAVYSNIANETLMAKAGVLGDRLAVSANVVGGKLKAKCSIICALDEVADYLEITPADIQWITDDMGVYFDVKSNVEWIVVVGYTSSDEQLFELSHSTLVSNATLISNMSGSEETYGLVTNVDMIKNSTLLKNIL